MCPYLRPVTLEMAKAYEEAGVDRLVLMCFAFGEDDLLQRLDELAPFLSL